jgi:hypothetical protein
LTHEIPNSINGHSVEQMMRTGPTGDGIENAYFVVGCPDCREKIVVRYLNVDDYSKIRRAKKWIIGFFLNNKCETS